MGSSFKFDTSKPGLQKVLKPYQEVALSYLWEIGDNGVGSTKVWKTVQEKLPHGTTISRTSIIFFLQNLTRQGILREKRVTGKGGYKAIYSPLMDKTGYVKYLLKTMVQSLIEDFPVETKEALAEI